MRHTSRCDAKRRSKTGTGTQETTCLKYPKVALATDCRTRLALAAVLGRGPASDPALFKASSGRAVGRTRIGTLLADADFDGQRIREYVRVPRRPHADLAAAWPALGEAADREVATVDEAAVRQERSMLSGGRPRRSTR